MELTLAAAARILDKEEAEQPTHNRPGFPFSARPKTHGSIVSMV